MRFGKEGLPVPQLHIFDIVVGIIRMGVFGTQPHLDPDLFSFPGIVVTNYKRSVTIKIVLPDFFFFLTDIDGGKYSGHNGMYSGDRGPFIDSANINNSGNLVICFEKLRVVSYSGNHSFVKMKRTGSILMFLCYLTILSTQTTSSELTTLFKMPMEYRIFYPDGDTMVRVLHSVNEETYLFDMLHAVDSIQIDPDDWVLNQVVGIKEIARKKGSREAFSIYPNTGQGMNTFELLDEREKDANVAEDVSIDFTLRPGNQFQLEI